MAAPTARMNPAISSCPGLPGSWPPWLQFQPQPSCSGASHHSRELFTSPASVSFTRGNGPIGSVSLLVSTHSNQCTTQSMEHRDIQKNKRAQWLSYVHGLQYHVVRSQLKSSWPGGGVVACYWVWCGGEGRAGHTGGSTSMGSGESDLKVHG